MQNSGTISTILSTAALFIPVDAPILGGASLVFGAISIKYEIDKYNNKQCDPEMLTMSIVSTATGGVGTIAKTGKLAWEGTSYGTSVYGSGRSFMDDKKTQAC